MRVVVTGAAGGIGSHVARRLRATKDFDVLATDRVKHARVNFPLTIADLLNRDAAYPLLSGAEALVHLGNHAAFHPPDAQMIFNENVCMNENVFQAAIDQGVRRIVFASSIQVIASRPIVGSHVAAGHPPYLPLDGDVPARPSNPYALSKHVSELMLEYYARQFDVSAVALRFPYTCEDGNWQLTESQLASGEGKRHAIDDALSFLLVTDAAALVEAILRATLPGFRVYQPGAEVNRLRLPTAQVVARHYTDWQVRVEAERMTGLVDNSVITRETGWRPRV